VAMATLAMAVAAVPTTRDSMTYHLARVAHWAQNRSVAWYPAHVLRQLHPPPWAEFAVLHLFVLAGGDRLANLVPWISIVGSVIATSLVARPLGAPPRGQILAAFVCATIPMGVLQASTTQNDYAASLWLVCLVHFLLALDSCPGVLASAGAGASLGLALSTKGTAYVFAVPFLVSFAAAGRARPGAPKLRHAPVLAPCAPPPPRAPPPRDPHPLRP